MTHLAAIARRQHGLVTVAQAVEAGMSRAAWYRCLADGRLEVVHPGVARMPGAAESPQQQILAAVLATGEMALASHTSSAFVWVGDVAGLDPLHPVHVLTTRSTPARRAGVAVHRPLDRVDLVPVLRQGIPTTRPLRMVADLGAVVRLSQLAAVIDQALVRRLFEFRALDEAIARHARRGRNGIGPLRAVVRELRLGDDPPDSVLEVEMGRLLASHGLSQPRFHPEVLCQGERFVPDFGYLVERVLIEVDGWAFHGDHRRFAADRRRDALLHAEGWVVLRFTWFQVRHEPTWVADRVRDVLALRSAA